MTQSNATPPTQVFAVFDAYGEGDGFTVFNLLGLFSSLVKAKEFAQEYVTANPRYGRDRDDGLYDGLDASTAKELQLVGYTLATREEIRQIDAGYGNNLGLVIEPCMLDSAIVEKE